VEEKLPDLIQATIETLLLAQAHLATTLATMRSQNTDLGPEYLQLEAEMTRILTALASMKFISERHSGAA
jgi:hypothetical protein